MSTEYISSLLRSYIYICERIKQNIRPYIENNPEASQNTTCSLVLQICYSSWNAEMLYRASLLPRDPPAVRSPLGPWQPSTLCWRTGLAYNQHHNGDAQSSLNATFSSFLLGCASVKNLILRQYLHWYLFTCEYINSTEEVC